MSTKKSLVIGDFLFCLEGSHAYATEGKRLYKRIAPGVFYLEKTKEQAAVDLLVSISRLTLFVIIFAILGVFDQIISLKALVVWFAMFVYVRIGGGK